MKDQRELAKKQKGLTTKSREKKSRKKSAKRSVQEFEHAYKQMARDESREANALEWSERTLRNSDVP